MANGGKKGFAKLNGFVFSEHTRDRTYTLNARNNVIILGIILMAIIPVSDYIEPWKAGEKGFY
jgi:hypothetical protein